MENMYDDLPADVDPRMLEEYLDRSPNMDSTNDEEEDDLDEDEFEEKHSQSSDQPPSTRLTIERVHLDSNSRLRENNKKSSRQALIERVDSGEMTIDPLAEEPSTSTSTPAKKNRRKWKQKFVRDEISTPQDSQKSTEKPTSKPRKRNRTDLFTTAEKKILAKEVKNCPPIWDLTSNDHSNSNVLSSCWKKIASILNRSEVDCKSVWTSLRESFRYHEKIKKKGKPSGSEGGDPIANPSYENSTNEWEFSMDLAFLPDTAKKRKTITSFFATDANNEGDETESSWPQGNYSYQTRTAASSSPFDDSVSQLASNVGELIEMQKSLTPQSSQQSQPQLVHHVALANIDRMLKKLPPNEIEDTLFEITNFIYEKIKNNRVMK